MTRRSVAALVALALLVSCAPAARPSPSPTAAQTSAAPTATASPTASPTASTRPTPTPTSSDPGRFGLLLRSSGRISVRSETTFATSMYAAGGEQPSASHDGRKIAFWRTGPLSNNPQELRVAELPSGAEKMLMALPSGFAGGPIVWASADDGLLYEVHSTELRPGAGGGPASSRLESFDLTAAQAPGATEAALTVTDGRVFVPVAWDRAGAMSSALTTGEGGFSLEYVTWDRKTQPAGQSATKSVRFPWQVLAFTVSASHDAKRILGIDGAANGLRVWPIADIAAGDLVRAAPKLNDARWRNGVPADISWVVGSNVEAFTYQTSTVTTWYEGRGGARILAWRVDGSGVVLFEPSRGTFIMPMPRQNPLQLFDQDAGVAGTVIVR